MSASARRIVVSETHSTSVTFAPVFRSRMNSDAGGSTNINTTASFSASTDGLSAALVTEAAPLGCCACAASFRCARYSAYVPGYPELIGRRLVPSTIGGFSGPLAQAPRSKMQQWLQMLGRAWRNPRKFARQYSIN
jgi:hypothetical protein